MKKQLLMSACLTAAVACGFETSETTESTLPGESEVFENDSDSGEEFQDPEDEEESEPEPLTDFSQWGPHYPYGITKETLVASVTGCDMEYEVYTPYAENPPTIILAHGFARGSGVMAGWAERFASWGIEVLLPTLCHYNILAGVDHEMNGLNLQELADVRGLSEVVYGGHSAGGLAAVIAASQDVRAIGLLGLDTTDTQGTPGVPDVIGRVYAGTVICPAFSLRGIPSTCNSDGNGIELFRMMEDYKAVSVSGADHCDFENPTDFICETACENSSSEYSDEEIREAIITLSTAAAVSLTNLSDDGSLVWEEKVEEWTEEGLISESE